LAKAAKCIAATVNLGEKGCWYSIVPAAERKAAQALPVADEARRFRGSGTICGLLAKAANRIAATVKYEGYTKSKAAMRRTVEAGSSCVSLRNSKRRTEDLAQPKSSP